MSMNESPLVSQKIKEYSQKHKFEHILNQTINNLLTTLPGDPYSTICELLKQVKNNKIIK